MDRQSAKALDLAAEVDCCVAVGRDELRLVHTHVAIAPTSPRAEERLRDQGLCTDGQPEQTLASGYHVYHSSSH